MKLAVVSDDGHTISRHFGRAEKYVVITIEDGVETGRELRDKLGHGHFAAGEGHVSNHGHHDHAAAGATRFGHDHGHGSHAKHEQMASAISDCSVLLTGGMGTGAYRSLMSLSIQPIITEYACIDDAVQSYLAGTIVHHIDRLH